MLFATTSQNRCRSIERATDHIEVAPSIPLNVDVKNHPRSFYTASLQILPTTCCRCRSCRCSCCLPNTKNYERDPLCLRSCRHFPAVYDFRGEESPSHPCVISISNLSVSSLDRVNSPSPPATGRKRIDVLLAMPRARADTWD